MVMETKGITTYRMSKDTGFSDSLIGYWKKGERIPSADKIPALCNYLEVSADYLLTGKESPPKLDTAQRELLDLWDRLDEDGRTIVKAKAIEELRRKGG